MSYDIKHRPTCYDEVLGQEDTIAVLRSIVAKGRGFQQSYLLCGPHGMGKTTLGRILARALLCSSPTEQGDPCDKCPSCRSLLEKGTSVDFIEVDAATNSGKAEINRIKEEIQYSSFSGRRPIYLFDEAHQLTPGALDALLLPMEEPIADTEDKELVCIFCTTEPEKMRDTVLSRCAPAFVIRPVVPDQLAEYLASICSDESIEFDVDMLRLIAEVSECHVRDALKSVEGVSMLGPINRENVVRYLHLDINSSYLDIIENIGQDLSVSLETARQVLERVSPVTCYKKLSEVSMLAFQSTLGINPPTFWNRDRLKALGERQGAGLLGFARQFADRPGRPTPDMLFCDIGYLHYVGSSVTGKTPLVVSPSPGSQNGGTSQQALQSSSNPVQKQERVSNSPSKVPFSGGEVPKDVRAIRNRGKEIRKDGKIKQAPGVLSSSEFSRLLALHLAEIGVENGSSGRKNMGSY